MRHVVIFVLLVFLFNVLVLSHLSGALSNAEQVKRFVFKRFARPVERLPPWRRTASDCLGGEWKSRTGVVFCKPREGGEWKSRDVAFREEWIDAGAQEVGLFDPRRNTAVVLKRKKAFRAEGRDREEAFKRVFDEVFLDEGGFVVFPGASDGGRMGGAKKVASKPVVVMVQPEEPKRKLKVNQPQVVTKSATTTSDGKAAKGTKIDWAMDCSHYWSFDETGFCRLMKQKTITAEWVEVDATTKTVTYIWNEMIHRPEIGEAYLKDEDRLMVLVILRRHILVGHLNAAEEAMDVAMETDQVFLRGGFWATERNFKPIPPNVKPDAVDNAQVVVMISSFRDVLCINTVKEAFDNAYNPDRIRIAIVLQGSKNDADCMEMYCQEVGEANCRRNQIVQLKLPLERSRGVMFARFLEQTLIKDEEFCLQIDSHMVFPEHWDKLALGDWLSAENEMAVMTTYPNRATDVNKQEFSPVRCDTVWGSNVVACGTSARNVRHKQKTPYLSAFFGAGIAFSKCHANIVVPYDPFMAWMFKGEEYNRSARLWTHGYDLYAPKVNYAYHFYDDDPRPAKYKNIQRDRSFFSDNKDSAMIVRQSEYRWQAVLGMLDPPSPVSEVQDDDRLARLNKAHSHVETLRMALFADVEYFGVGTKRSLREYQVFSGINLIKHTMKDLCDKIGELPMVPWQNQGYNVWGAGCTSEKRSCCKTTMDKILEKNNAFLPDYVAYTNEQWANHIKSSPVFSSQKNGSLIKQPIMSLGWAKAENICD